MTYVATFFSHYGALTFSRGVERLGQPAKMMPVPRSLSTSCGTGVRFELEGPVEEALAGLFDEETEKIFALEDGQYRLVLNVSGEE